MMFYVIVALKSFNYKSLKVVFVFKIKMQIYKFPTLFYNFQIINISINF